MVIFDSRPPPQNVSRTVAFTLIFDFLALFVAGIVLAAYQQTHNTALRALIVVFGVVILVPAHAVAESLGIDLNASLDDSPSWTFLPGPFRVLLGAAVLGSEVILAWVLVARLFAALGVPLQ